MSRADSPLRDRMIFLVGARRSGTNWLQRVVAAHPDVASIPSETYLFSRGIAPLRERFHHGVQSSPGTGFLFMDKPELLDALRNFCDRALSPYLAAAPSASRLAERTPEHVTSLDLIGDIYPDAYVVHIVRDGRDVARSLLNQKWASAPKNIEEAAEEWRSCVESAEAGSRKLSRYRVIRYEELLRDPTRQVADLYEWLGVAKTPALVEAGIVESEIPYNVDPGAPALSSGKWRGSFSSQDIDTFMRIAGDALRRLGYEAPDIGVSDAPREETSAAEAKEAAPKKRRFLARGTRNDDGEGPIEKKILSRTVEVQRLLDRVVSSINTRRLEQLSAMASRTIMVRVVSHDDDWKARGPTALARLAEVVERDEALDGRQIRGDFHSGVPTASAVMTFRDRNGQTHVRIVVATITGRDKVSRVTYYQFPNRP